MAICCSFPKPCPTLCDPMDCSTPGFPSFTLSSSLLKLMSTESVMPSNHLILCQPFSFCLQSFPVSVFSSELACHLSWPKYGNFGFSISPSNEYSGFISFRIDWFDFLAVHGTLKDFLQHYNSKASVLWCSAFFMVQLSHPTWLLEKL